MSVENLILREVVSVFLKADNGSFLMQLRDDIPSIVFPEHWGLFGGTIESGESVCEAASRELEEEIALRIIPKEIVKFRQYLQSNYRVHTCFHYLKTPISILNLQEGVDFGLFSINEILTGRLLSQKLNASFPVADPLIGYFRDVSNIVKRANLL